MNKPSQEIIVGEKIDWNKVESRLCLHPNMDKHFPLETMKSCASIPPYFSHFLAWRLGTWEGEEWFSFLEDLMLTASNIPGWHEHDVTHGCDHNSFWGYLWEIQVACWLKRNENNNIEWLPQGPDLKIETPHGNVFVECTTYLKSFAHKLYISELLCAIDPHLKVEHTPCTIFSLPKNNNVESFLDDLFSPFLDPKYIVELAKAAKIMSPVCLPVPKGLKNLFVIYEADESEESNPNQPWGTAGDPDQYLSIAREEALNNKRYSNQLVSHRPNLLAINFLLGDSQFARMLSRDVPIPEFGLELDAVLFSACGIDDIPSANNSVLIPRIQEFPLSL